MKKLDAGLLAACLALVVAPLLFVGKVKESDSEIFAGADIQVEAVVAQIQPSYKPWIKPLWVPPSKEIESMLFAFQAAIGGGFVGFFVGRKSATHKRGKNS